MGMNEETESVNDWELEEEERDYDNFLDYFEENINNEADR